MLEQILNQIYQGRQIQLDPFSYTATFSALAAAGQATANINIQADSDFVILNTTYFADIAAAAQTSGTIIVPLVNALLTDSGSGRNLMDATLPVYSIFGDGHFPYIWPQPKLLASKSTLQVQVTNFSAATTYNLRLQFNGVKIFVLG